MDQDQARTGTPLDCIPDSELQLSASYQGKYQGRTARGSTPVVKGAFLPFVLSPEVPLTLSPSTQPLVKLLTSVDLRSIARSTQTGTDRAFGSISSCAHGTNTQRHALLSRIDPREEDL